MKRDRLKPTPHQGFSDCTHVGRLKNRGKPHGEAVLIFWLGELQVRSDIDFSRWREKSDTDAIPDERSER